MLNAFLNAMKANTTLTVAKIIYLKSHGLHIFVKFTKNKMGYASGFRAINGLPRALWDKTGSASLTNIPFPYAHTPFGPSVTQHSEGLLDTVSSIVDQTMADEAKSSWDWQK